MPPTVGLLEIGDVYLDGSIDAALLPECMHRLYLQGNNFTGNIIAANTVKNLRSLNVARNAFTEEFHAAYLSRRLEDLAFYSNKFSVESISYAFMRVLQPLSTNVVRGRKSIRNDWKIRVINLQVLAR